MLVTGGPDSGVVCKKLENKSKIAQSKKGKRKKEGERKRGISVYAHPCLNERTLLPDSPINLDGMMESILRLIQNFSMNGIRFRAGSLILA
jgi:hypothetical protein